MTVVSNGSLILHENRPKLVSGSVGFNHKSLVKVGHYTDRSLSWPVSIFQKPRWPLHSSHNNPFLNDPLMAQQV